MAEAGIGFAARLSGPASPGCGSASRPAEQVWRQAFADVDLAQA